MTNRNVLIITTSASHMNDGSTTGLWLEELTTPYYAFLDSDANVTLASIKGGEIPIDDRSLADAENREASVERYMQDGAAQAAVSDTQRFDSLNPDDYDAIFLPGGHGTMFDFPDNPDLARLIETFDREGKLIAAVCHGPAALAGPTRPDGTPLVQGRKLAAFTDSEERAVGLDKAVPFLLASRLVALGADHHSANDFEPFALRDGNLVTGQNPQSAEKVAQMVLDALDDAKQAA